MKEQTLGKFISIALLTLVSVQAQAQNGFKKIKEWNSKPVASVAVDRLGNFFLVYAKGGVKKFDPDGKKMASLSGIKPTLLEPWFHPAIFIYDRATQKYFSYGRFFENVQVKDIEPQFAIEPYLACPTHDNRLWILDRADYSLKKINPRTEEVISEFAIPLGGAHPAFTFLREYQNFLFLSDETSGIWILNVLGQLEKKIQRTGEGNFNFFGQELYYLDKNIVRFYNLVTGATSELEVSGDTKFAIVTDERILTVSLKNKVTLYQNNLPTD